MTTMTIDQPVLVLNKSWAALNATNMKRALKMVIKGRAKIVNPDDFQALTWEDWSRLRPDKGDDAKTFSAMGRQFRLPEVIVLTEYDKMPKPKNSFSRRMLFRRDHHRCQYCGCQPGTEELNIDHVVPRSKGGLTTWENCVASCIDCNSRKANKTLREAGMTLLTTPTKPKHHLSRFPSVRIDSWQTFLGEMYWTVPLID